MAEGNGIDLGSIYGLLLEVAKTVSRHDAVLLSLQDEMTQMRTELKGDILNVRTEVAALRTETRSDVAALQQTITQYHSSVVGHGIPISELKEWVRRIESHLDLPAHISG